MNAPDAFLTAIGLMSGTSMDGIDVALVETDGETVRRFGPTGSRPYGDDERAAIARAVRDARGMTSAAERPVSFEIAERVVTQAHIEAIKELVHKNGISIGDINIFGFHGQTVLHRPELGFTVQLGDGPALAREFGIDVIHDLRAADMAHGGQGAPLVPVFHRALVRASGLELPVVVANIGGVANVTWIGDGDPIAFDTGPGNALIDDLVRDRTGLSFDLDGRLAVAGTVDRDALSRLMENDYFTASPPKSLDRDAFDVHGLEQLSVEDAAATLAAFTAEALAAAQSHFPAPPRRWIVSGGGARNPAILSTLASRVAAPVTTADAVGWSGDHVEAQAFAFLAVRSLKGLPLTFPTTTGVRQPQSGGVLAPALRP
jgi:anhydro-N-acetylmuramic acid kinase